MCHYGDRDDNLFCVDSDTRCDYIDQCLSGIDEVNCTEADYAGVI